MPSKKRKGWRPPPKPTAAQVAQRRADEAALRAALTPPSTWGDKPCEFGDTM